ncbi:unnamed protein product, partial [Porites evermanni]
MAFSGVSGSMEEDFFTKTPILKNCSPEQKSNCRTCEEACHSPFNNNTNTVETPIHDHPKCKDLVTYKRLLSRTQTTRSLFREEVQVHILYGSYAMCGSMLSIKSFIYSNQQSAHSKHSDPRICQVVAHKRIKTPGKLLNFQAQKVAAVAYRKWSFTRDSKSLTGKVLVFWIGGPQIISNNKDCLQFIPHEELQIQYKDDEDIFVNLRLGDSFHDAFRCAQPVSDRSSSFVYSKACHRHLIFNKVKECNHLHLHLRCQ